MRRHSAARFRSGGNDRPREQSDHAANLAFGVTVLRHVSRKRPHEAFTADRVAIRVIPPPLPPSLSLKSETPVTFK